MRGMERKKDYNDNLDYRVEHIFNNRKYGSMDCKGCEHYKNVTQEWRAILTSRCANILKMTGNTHKALERTKKEKGG